MKYKSVLLMGLSFISLSTLASPQLSKEQMVKGLGDRAATCHVGKYISGILSNSSTGYSAVFISDTINSPTDGSRIVFFAASDSSPSAKNMYNMAQNAMNLNHPILYALCDNYDQIVALSIKRDA
ncbi:hypothetical protein [Enterobacter kobei]|uniref:hypothetical protein n=1 Tax=Enterobacter kobei TaxID=208224 RepID=UPI003BE0FFC3